MRRRFPAMFPERCRYLLPRRTGRCGGALVQNGPLAGSSAIVRRCCASLDPEQYTTSTRNLAAHFDWLASHGYHVISLQQLIDARIGHGTLPGKAVLLTFDDGLRSAYTKVFPLLKA